MVSSWIRHGSGGVRACSGSLMREPSVSGDAATAPPSSPERCRRPARAAKQLVVRRLSGELDYSPLDGAHEGERHGSRGRAGRDRSRSAPGCDQMRASA